MITREWLILIAGILHLWLILSMAFVPDKLKWKEHITKLPLFMQRLFWVYGVFIAITVLGLGIITITQAGEIATGTPLARAITGFMGIFWFLRLVTQFTVMRIIPLPEGFHWKMAMHSLTAVFLYLTVVYAYIALSPAL